MDFRDCTTGRASGWVVRAVAVVALACGPVATPTPTPRAEAPSASSAPPLASAPRSTGDGGADGVTLADAGGAPPVASAVVDAGAPKPAPPPPVTRTGKTWPFHTWSRAEAVAFNERRYGPGPQLRAYDDSGWSPLVTKKKPLSTAEAQEALKLINDTLGDVEVSKCPFPRHAVVLFDGDVPVASINVCFQCGDILVWPSWTTPPLDWAHWDQLTVGQRHTLEAMQKKKLSLHEHFFPAWKAFFRDKVGFPIDVKYDAFD